MISKIALQYMRNSFINQGRIQTSYSLKNSLSQNNRVSLYNLSRNHFSSEQTSQTAENGQSKINSQEQQQYEKPKSQYQQDLEKRYPKEHIQQVQAQLKSQKLSLYDYLLTVNNQTRDNFNYSSDILINNKIDYKYLKDDPKKFLILTTFWSGIGFLSTFLHPYLAVFPAIFGAGGLFSYIAGKRLVRKTIEKIEFVPNEIEKVRIYLVKGDEPILCRIDQIEVVDVNEKIEHPYISDKVFRNKKQMIDLQKDISITLNAQDMAGATFNALNLVIFGNKDLTQVPNYNLLETVLEGDILRLNKFKVNKKDSISEDFIDNMLIDQTSQKIHANKKQKDEQINELEEQIQQEIQRFSKKK